MRDWFPHEVSNLPFGFLHISKIGAGGGQGAITLRSPIYLRNSFNLVTNWRSNVPQLTIAYMFNSILVMSQLDSMFNYLLLRALKFPMVYNANFASAMYPKLDSIVYTFSSELISTTSSARGVSSHLSNCSPLICSNLMLFSSAAKFPTKHKSQYTTLLNVHVRSQPTW